MESVSALSKQSSRCSTWLARSGTGRMMLPTVSAMRVSTGVPSASVAEVMVSLWPWKILVNPSMQSLARLRSIRSVKRLSNSETSSCLPTCSCPPLRLVTSLSTEEGSMNFWLLKISLQKICRNSNIKVDPASVEADEEVDEFEDEEVDDKVGVGFVDSVGGLVGDAEEGSAEAATPLGGCG